MRLMDRWMLEQMVERRGNNWNQKYLKSITEIRERQKLKICKNFPATFTLLRRNQQSHFSLFGSDTKETMRAKYLSDGLSFTHSPSLRCNLLFFFYICTAFLAVFYRGDRTIIICCFFITYIFLYSSFSISLCLTLLNKI